MGMLFCCFCLYFCCLCLLLFVICGLLLNNKVKNKIKLTFPQQKDKRQKTNLSFFQ